MAIKSLVSSAWQEVDTLKVPVSGAYQEADHANALVSSAWQEVWSNLTYFLQGGYVANGAEFVTTYMKNYYDDGTVFISLNDNPEALSNSASEFIKFASSEDMKGKTLYVQFDTNYLPSSDVNFRYYISSSTSKRLTLTNGGSGLYYVEIPTDMVVNTSKLTLHTSMSYSKYVGVKDIYVK